MTRRSQQSTVSVFVALMLVAAATYADDSVAPERVLMTEHALSAEQAQTMQQAWAEHIGFEVVFENSIGMQLRVIPPGTYRISSRRVEEDQKGPFGTSLSQAFLIGQFEVTQGEWQALMENNPSEDNNGSCDDCFQCIFFVKHLNQAFKLKGPKNVNKIEPFFVCWVVL